MSLNKVYILPRISHPYQEGNVLYSDDIDHQTIFSSLGFTDRECIDSIYTKGVFETVYHIRKIVRYIDYLLKVGGKLHIEFFRLSFDSPGHYLRPLNFVMNEISLVFKRRIKLISKNFDGNIDRFIFEKVGSCFNLNDSNKNWSFCIVTDGKNLDNIERCIRSIERQNIPNYEINLCCPRSISVNGAKVVPDDDLYFDIRVPISAKKNKVVGSCIYENILMLHDRLYLSNDWYSHISEVNSCYDVLVLRIINEESGNRMNDWICTISDKNLFHKKGEVLPYNKYKQSIYINGGALCIKKQIYNEVLHSDFLNWGEMEDVDFSNKLMLHGFDITLFTRATLYSDVNRFTGTRGENKVNLKRIILAPYSFIISFKKKHEFRVKFSKFLSAPFSI
jgi:hypothetical protein